MRLFFAAFPSPDIRRRIELATACVRLPSGARRIPAENYHMTLAFAGEVTNVQAGALRSSATRVRAAGFEVRFEVLEHWPKAEVVVAAANDTPAGLDGLHRSLCADFQGLGLPLEPRPFRAHVTIARKIAQAPVLQAMSEISWTVQSFQLVRSARSTGGSIYTVVDSWPLLDKAPAAE